jgi:maleylacetate reductase
LCDAGLDSARAEGNGCSGTNATAARTVPDETREAGRRTLPMRDFVYEPAANRVVFGAGAARSRLSAELDRLGAGRVFVITGNSSPDAVAAILGPLGDRVIATFRGVQPHVPVAVAARVRTEVADADADCLLSIGGGSATGTAKAAALTSRLPIVAVPTTYAGSEVTAVWGLTDAGRKKTGTDPVVLPRTVIYDPELTVSLPTELTAASGLNAMAHSVEAFWAPGRNPVTSVLAAAAVLALRTGLTAVVADGTDLDAQAEVLYGAYLAASSFAVTGSGLHHKICHVLGGAFDLPHAQTHAIVLPHVLAFNAPYAPEAARALAEAFGRPDAVAGLRALTAQLGIPRGLRDLGMPVSGIDEAAGLIEPAIPADNPRPVSRADLVRLLQDAWSGTATPSVDNQPSQRPPAQ